MLLQRARDGDGYTHETRDGDGNAQGTLAPRDFANSSAVEPAKSSAIRGKRGRMGAQKGMCAEISGTKIKSPIREPLPPPPCRKLVRGEAPR